MAKKYLITGGAGFIGSALTKRLVAQGSQVRVLDNNFRGAKRKLEEVLDNIEFVEADIRDAEAVKKAGFSLKSAELVYKPKAVKSLEEKTAGERVSKFLDFILEFL